MNFTDAVVVGLKLPRGKSDLIVFDDRRPGLGVRLRARSNGATVNRTWIVQCRVHGRTQRHDLGPVVATPTKQARALADKIFAKVRQGVDPKAEKRSARVNAAETFERLSSNFLKAARARWRARTYEEIERHLMTHFAPLHSEPVQAIDRKTVAAALSRIADNSGPVAANRARASLSSFFAWAIAEGFTEANPVSGTMKREEKSRSRVLSAAELAAVWQACRDDDYGRIVRLLILTGQRRDEIGGIAESELLRDLRVWSLPAERTKNGRPHDVPLSDATLTLLPALRDGRTLLFGVGAGPFSGWSRSKARLDARIKEASRDGQGIAPWTLHDLRRSAATGMAEIGVQPHIIEAVLNHASGARAGVAGIYNRAQYSNEKRDALTRWAAHVAKIVKGRANVVTLVRHQ